MVGKGRRRRETDEGRQREAESHGRPGRLLCAGDKIKGIKVMKEVRDLMRTRGANISAKY